VKRRVHGASSIFSFSSERLFESLKWWALQRESNGDILKVHQAKIKCSTNNWAQGIYKGLYFFDNLPITD